MGKESELVEKFISVFGDSFHEYNTECWDVTRKNRIDVICYCTEDIALGIEFKKENSLSDRRHGAGLGEWLKQAERYTQAEFFHNYHKQYERIPIFVIPAVTYKHLVFVPDKHAVPEGKPKNSHNNVNSFIFKAFNIGEFRDISSTEYIFNANCKTIATIKKVSDKWRCYSEPDAYRLICNWLGIYTEYVEQLNINYTQNKNKWQQ